MFIILVILTLIQLVGLFANNKQKKYLAIYTGFVDVLWIIYLANEGRYCMMILWVLFLYLDFYRFKKLNEKENQGEL